MKVSHWLASLGMHLLQSEDGDEGIDAFGIRVADLAAAKSRALQLGLQIVEPPSYLAAIDCACVAPSDCFGVSLVLVEGSAQLLS